MVTFAFPGENNAAAGNAATPKTRPPLPFAKRSFANSPFGGSAKRPLGTPRTATSANRGFLGREEPTASALTNNNIAAARNIFRASSISDSPSPTIFSPSLPASTMKRVFAPSAATPEPARTYRDSTATATPRGMAAKAASEELFNMRIPSPSNDLSGEALTRKVPKDWASKSSIYADQYLEHLCPPNFDDEQRRQFFCILDLRRLKYAADEIFAKRDWKLNIINFAKEFEKSRSIILLRYGLYKFQNVQPSKDVMKRWRREHGLPDPEEDATEATPSKGKSAKKRKSEEDPSTSRKRKNVEEEPADTAKVAEKTPVPAKTKKRFMDEDEEQEQEQEQPAKLQKSSTESTPSAAKSLFEKVANKAFTPAATSPSKSNAFLTGNPVNGSLGKSVFSNIKPSTGASTGSGGNIFGHLSDNSAQNSGVEADAESETDSEAEKDEEPSVGASGADSSSQATSNLFGKKATQDSEAGTRESTPGRSLFERVSAGQNGEPKRAEQGTESKAPKTMDQTWNPSTTPIKFAPSTSTSNSGVIFGASQAAAPGGDGGLFGVKAPTSSASTLFGAVAPKNGEPAAASTSATETKEQGESDKENEAQATTTKSIFGGSSITPTPASTLFGAKPASSEPTKALESTKPASTLFGSSTPASGTSNLFGANKPADSPSTSAVSQPSTLFGSKPAEAAKLATEAKSLFGAAATPTESQSSSNVFGGSSVSAPNNKPVSNIFGNPSTSKASNLFGGSTSTSSGQAAFGAVSAQAPEAAKPDAAKLAAAPAFSFSQPNGTSQPGSKPLFAPKSPPSSGTANLFAGSPMKQDEPSPAKRAFTGSASGDSVPQFAFGVNQNGSTSNIFGGSNGTSTNETGSGGLFGGQSQGTASAGSSFNFNFGGNSANSSFNNPFAASGAGNSSTAGINNDAGGNSSGMFGFSAGGSSTPSGTASPFQFGGSTNGASSTTFGTSGDSAKPAPSMFSFSGAPQSNTGPGSGTGAVFGNPNPNPPSFGNLQPPTGGSTTGTNTPFTLGGGSSLATTPAAGTPEPSGQGEGAGGKTEAEGEEGKTDEQVNLTEGAEADEETLHEVRAKALKFVKESDGEEKSEGKSKSPWSTQGVGSLKLLKHKETKAVRLLLRAEPRGHVAMNRAVLPDFNYEANEKYVKLMTSNDKGDGLETWMIQVKTKDLAKALAGKLEEHKDSNKKEAEK